MNKGVDVEQAADIEEALVIDVHDSFAIITARMKVREIAGANGFNILDQARISLATSSLAYMLGLGGARHDRIIIGCVKDGNRRGIKVICERVQNVGDDVSPKTFEDTRWMVDELTVNHVSNKDVVQVIAVKWKGDI